MNGFPFVERDERRVVMNLGLDIGFGRLMQLAERCWREWAATRGLEGSEHTTGPCAALMVPCPCGAPVKCAWCCGSGRVTKRVREAVLAERGVLTLKTIPKEKLVELADKHIAHFGRLIEAGKAGHRGVRVDECEGYRDLWTETRRRLLADEELSPPQLGEIQDAIECGDYDELLGLVS